MGYRFSVSFPGGKISPLLSCLRDKLAGFLCGGLSVEVNWRRLYSSQCEFRIVSHIILSYLLFVLPQQPRKCLFCYLILIKQPPKDKDWCGGQSQCRSSVRCAATSIRVELSRLSDETVRRYLTLPVYRFSLLDSIWIRLPNFSNSKNLEGPYLDQSSLVACCISAPCAASFDNLIDRREFGNSGFEGTRRTG